ncbi:MAG: AmmeMemoRadiSam system protein B [Deltaproteobacteria bacterium]|nr:AmmeMemoRadiSam system protein B [Deltaproteobacteria bacterium]
MERLLIAAAVLVLSAPITAASCDEKKAVQKPAAAREEAGVSEKKSEPAERPGAPIAGAFRPQVAGAFYPGDAKQLRAEIQGYLDDARKSGKRVQGDLLGIVVPHAGYPYSGPVAAHAFAQLEGRSYRRVVVLAPAHRRGFDTPALLDAPAYRTPLGDMPIDRQGVAALARSGAARVDQEKFTQEHALEVELPFLQAVLGSFELVPIMLSGPDLAAAERLARALQEAFPARDTLFVASTDMSHDYPYDVAVAMDRNALRYVEALDSQGLQAAYDRFRRAGDAIRAGDGGKVEPDCAQLCGMGPVLTLIELARLQAGKVSVRTLDRRNSGDVVGNPRSRIVGYCAVAIALAEPRPEAKPAAKPADKPSRATGGEQAGSTGDYLSAAEKQELLGIARKTLEAVLAGEPPPDFSQASAKLSEPGAAFVTLKSKGQLRGCIGYMEPADPLWRMVRDRAIDAAKHDTRFRPVSSDELAKIEIEISVLTPRVAVSDPLRDIRIGRDGVWLELGHHRGVFLPQVPVEQGWDTVEEYLDMLCRKAHVPMRGCWRSAEAKLQRFTALVFSE